MLRLINNSTSGADGWIWRIDRRRDDAERIEEKRRLKGGKRERE